MNLKLKMKILEAFRSQADFAQVIGIGESRLSRIIRGRIEPTSKEKTVIAKKLHEQIPELFPEARQDQNLGRPDELCEA